MKPTGRVRLRVVMKERGGIFRGKEVISRFFAIVFCGDTHLLHQSQANWKHGLVMLVPVNLCINPTIEEDSSLGIAAAVGSRVHRNITGKRKLADIRLQKRCITLHIATAVLILHLL